MSNPILDKYFADQKIDSRKKDRALSDLRSGKVSESNLASMLADKYKNEGVATSTGGGARGINVDTRSALRKGIDVYGQAAAGGMSGASSIYTTAGNYAGGAGKAAEMFGKGMSYVDPTAYIDPAGKGIFGRTGEAAGKAGEELQRLGKDITDTVKRGIAQNVDTSSGAFRGGEGMGAASSFVAGQIMPVVATAGLAGKGVSAIGSGLTKSSPFMRAMLTGGGSLGGAGRYLGKNIVTGAAATEAASIGSSGDFASPGELGVGAAIDTAFPLLGAIMKSGGKGLVRGLMPFTPTQKAILNRKGVDYAKTFLDQIGPTSTRSGIAKKANDQIKNLIPKRNAAVTQLKKQDWSVSPKDITGRLDEFTQNARKFVDQASEGDRPRLYKTINNEISAIKKRIGKGPISAKRADTLKKYFDHKLNYNKLDPANTVKNAVSKDTADLFRKALSDASKDYAEVNAKLGPLFEIRNVIEGKGAYSGVLGDLLSFAGGAAGAISSGGSAITEGAKLMALKNILLGTPGRSLGGKVLYEGGKVAGSEASKATAKQFTELLTDESKQ